MTIFQMIINRSIPSYIVYEDDLVIAFLDIQQTTKGHTLVVPKEPYENIFDIPNDLLNHLMSVVKMLSLKIKNAFNATGINLLNNNGKDAGQTVFHYHFHIIPRYKNDSLKIEFTDHSKTLDEVEYKKRASAILAQ
ncbi:MAG TPA: HIT family protein [Acholeplasmataceae bacterium]|nr:HIT family protein [Acholeplasmataceae bacterium]